jgi:hypothetical protein
MSWKFLARTQKIRGWVFDLLASLLLAFIVWTTGSILLSDTPELILESSWLLAALVIDIMLWFTAAMFMASANRNMERAGVVASTTSDEAGKVVPISSASREGPHAS